MQFKIKKFIVPPISLAVSQYFSFIFYAIAFLAALKIYEASRLQDIGLGFLTADILRSIQLSDSADQSLRYIILYLMILTNASRFYLSNWIVEASEPHKKLRENLPGKALMAEWVLRACCIFCVYAIPLTIKIGGYGVELLLVLMFGSLFLWDMLMCKWSGSYGSSLSEEHRNVVKNDVRGWRLLEGIGLGGSILYGILSLCFARELLTDNTYLLIGSGVLLLSFVVIALWDLGKHFTSYVSIGLWIIVGFLIVRLLRLFIATVL